ncbi:MAG TPA: hypothetical protein VEY13_10445 [Rubrobacteraceae bacterium]|nr:hypothetical protein [Rubrobacteraceae bacterium]
MRIYYQSFGKPSHHACRLADSSGARTSGRFSTEACEHCGGSSAAATGATYTAHPSGARPDTTPGPSRTGIEAPFAPPAVVRVLLRLPILRALLARIIGFGPLRARLKD